MEYQLLEQRAIASTCTTIRRRTFLLCFFFLVLASTAFGATEYTVCPFPSNQSGASLAGEDVQEIEVKPIPYWMFLLMLGFAQVTPAPEFLYPIKFVPVLGGCKRIGRSNTLKNLNRERLYDFIKSCPGTCFSEIIKKTRLNRGTVKYHMEVLETENMIESYKGNGKIRYFQNSSTYEEKDKAVIAALKNDMDQRIILEILNGQCSTNETLVEKMGISASTISWHIKHLKEQGIVEDDRQGQYTTYNINSDYLNSILVYVDNVNS
ncbi:MAG TPA: winged helix-turn-helix transcriptional regulator [Methanosarcinaceae archaeon]|nr:winged helix-turn-helix transcriptional regulator [Methanosarcinaceae archaeon]